MLLDETLRAAWFDYHREVHEIAADFSCCRGLFVSWEEIWHAYGHFQQQSLEDRARAAQALGFSRYLREEGLEELEAIPEKDALGAAHYHRFINRHMAALFEEARRYSPSLGVEFRVDRDAVQENGETRWLDNEQFSGWEPARYSYWAPFMHAQNAGESLDADAALTSLATTLDETSGQGAYPGQVVEQFNFIENTREYQGTHAAIREDALEAFLEGAAPLLAKQCTGYGIWAPRDYRCTVLYNAALLDNCRGWQLQRAAPLAAGGVRLRRRAALRQELRPRIAWIPRMHPFTHLCLEATVDRSLWPIAPTLRARLNGGAWTTLAQSDDGVLRGDVPIDFDSIPEAGLTFELENCGRGLKLRRLQLYHLSYAMDIRRADGSPGRYREVVVAFNERLAKLDAARSE